MSSKPYFDAVAGQRDTLRAGFFSEEVRRRALEAAGVHPGQRAADIGAGSGFLTEALLAAGLFVTAVDQSKAMLAVMAAKFGPRPDLTLVPGQAGSLPLPEGSQDHVLANMYLHHVEDPAAAVAEMARLLRPGGRLVVTDLDEHDFDFLRQEHHDRWMGFKRPDVERWLREAALDDVAVDRLDRNCCADSCCGQQRAEISIFMASGTRRQP